MNIILIACYGLSFSESSNVSDAVLASSVDARRSVVLASESSLYNYASYGTWIECGVSPATLTFGKHYATPRILQGRKDIV